jgi:hypothetical protein
LEAGLIAPKARRRWWGQKRTFVFQNAEADEQDERKCRPHEHPDDFPGG